VTGLSWDWWNVIGAEKSSINSSGIFQRMDPQMKPYDYSWSPMVGTTYNFNDGTKVFASWARKVRFPTLQYLYSTSNGNPDLRPEKSDNYVVGISRGITQYAKGEASLFIYDIQDMIVRPSSDPTSRYGNLGKVLLWGFEVGTEIFPTNDLTFRAGYTYMNATNKTPGSPTERVLYIPSHKVDLAVKYLVPFVKVGIDLTGSYVSRTWDQLPSIDRPTDATLRAGDYFIADARISKMLFKNFEVYFAARNILDKDYEQEIGFPAPGRNLFAGIKYSY
jgi:iron complex outermembrane recepter protein